jgi:hypothetical protein
VADPERLGFWNIFIDVRGDWSCVASKDLAGLSDQEKFKSKGGAPFSLLFDIVDAIKAATSATPYRPDILVSLETDPAGGNFIVKAESEPAPRTRGHAMASVASSPKTNGRAKKRSPSTPKKVVRGKAKDNRVKNDGPKRGQSKAEKSKSAKSKASKAKPREPKAGK